MPAAEVRRSTSLARRALTSVLQWIDSDYTPESPEKIRAEPDRVDWMRCIPFIILHAGCFGALWVGVSPFAVWISVVLRSLRKYAVHDLLIGLFSLLTYHLLRF